METPPEKTLRRFMQQRRVRPHFTFTLSPRNIWVCRTICGPYTSFGTGKSRDRAKLISVGRMWLILGRILVFPWMTDLGEGAIGTEDNRKHVIDRITTIAHRVKDHEATWTDGHALLFHGELWALLRSQRIDLEENIYIGQNGYTIFWKLDTMPNIVRASKGLLQGVLRYNLLLSVISAYKQQLENNEDIEMEARSPRRRHPISRLREYMRARLIEPDIKLSRITSWEWDCRITCGPYLIHGQGHSKGKALSRASKAMLEIIHEKRRFLWLEQDIRWNDEIEEEANRGFLREILTRIEMDVIGSRYWWSDSCATLFQEELAYLLHSQGAGVWESIYPGQQESLIVWEITVEPRIVQVASGRIFNQIRFDLLLGCIHSLRTRLDMIERMDE